MIESPTNLRLLAAARRGDLGGVRAEIARGIVFSRDDALAAAVDAACANGHALVTGYLLDHHAKLSQAVADRACFEHGTGSEIMELLRERDPEMALMALIAVAGRTGFPV